MPRTDENQVAVVSEKRQGYRWAVRRTWAGAWGEGQEREESARGSRYGFIPRGAPRLAEFERPGVDEARWKSGFFDGLPAWPRHMRRIGTRCRSRRRVTGIYHRTSALACFGHTQIAHLGRSEPASTPQWKLTCLPLAAGSVFAGDLGGTRPLLASFVSVPLMPARVATPPSRARHWPTLRRSRHRKTHAGA